jgi:hypothetical protein
MVAKGVVRTAQKARAIRTTRWWALRAGLYYVGPEGPTHKDAIAGVL